MLKKIARNVVPAELKDILFARLQGPLLSRLKSLDVRDSGVTDDGVPYVAIKDGFVFHGYPAGLWQRSLWRCCPRAIKRKIDPRAFGVALDILARYMGPDTPDKAIRAGKYYGFGPGDVVVECGAFIGFYALRASEIIGPAGLVVAVEAIRENFDLLDRNVRTNDCANIQTIERAVWREMSTLSMGRERRQRASLIDGTVAREQELSVQADTLDGILAEMGVDEVDFVRLQLNGAECAALCAMPETLSKRPSLLIAVPYAGPGSERYSTMKRVLHAAGYELRLEGETLFARPK